MSWFDEAGSGHEVDAAALLDSKAGEMMWAIVQAGAMVSVGLTSDGGALMVSVTLDGKWRRQYFRETEELELWLTGALSAVESAVRPADASPGRRQRSRRSP